MITAKKMIGNFDCFILFLPSCDSTCSGNLIIIYNSENNGERVTHSYNIKEQDQWCLCTLGYLKAFSRQYATEVSLFHFDQPPVFVAQPLGMYNVNILSGKMTISVRF